MSTLQIQVNHVASSTEAPKNDSKKLGIIKRVMASFTAHSQARSIIKGLKEVEEIKSGKVKAMSFEDAIKSL